MTNVFFVKDSTRSVFSIIMELDSERVCALCNAKECEPVKKEHRLLGSIPASDILLSFNLIISSFACILELILLTVLSLTDIELSPWKPAVYYAITFYLHIVSLARFYENIYKLFPLELFYLRFMYVVLTFKYFSVLLCFVCVNLTDASFHDVLVIISFINLISLVVLCGVVYLGLIINFDRKNSMTNPDWTA